MDLDEMKAVWSDLSDQLAQQKKTNQDIILKMTQEKSSSRLGRIIMMETVGLTVSLGMLVYLILNFQKLDYWSSIAGGIGMIFILLLGIVFGIRIIRQAQKIDVMQNSFSVVTQDFNQLKKILGQYKKLSIWMAVVSPSVCIPLFYDLFRDKSIEDDIRGVAIGVIFAALLTPLILKFFFWYYSRNVSQVKKALNDIDFKD